MGRGLTWQQRVSRDTLTLARTAQAATIDAIDRTIGSPVRRVSALGRLCNLQLDLIEAHLASPQEVMEVGYTTLERLVALHHQFAERLLEVVDTRETEWIQSPSVSRGGAKLASISYLSSARKT